MTDLMKVWRFSGVETIVENLGKQRRAELGLGWCLFSPSLPFPVCRYGKWELTWLFQNSILQLPGES